MNKQRQTSAVKAFFGALAMAAAFSAAPHFIEAAEIVRISAEPPIIEAASSTSVSLVAVEARDTSGISSVNIDLSPLGLATLTPMVLATGTSENGIWELPVASENVGDFNLSISLSNGSGSTSTSTVSLSSRDTVIPAISLLGDNPMTVILGSVWTDPGATAEDAVDGLLAVTASSSVDTSATGTYSVVYSAVDQSGNRAAIERSVSVASSSGPLPPIFSSAIAIPAAVFLNETFSFQVGVWDNDGIATVTIDLKDLNGASSSPMALISGSSTNGIWTRTASSSAAGNFLIPVTAFDGQGNMSSTSIHLTVSATSSMPAPTGLVADEMIFGRIKLNWNQVAGASKYEIYCNSTSTPLASIPGTEYLHYGIVPNSTYTYWITAVSGNGQKSALSESVSAKALAQEPGGGFSGIFMLTPIEPKEIENFDVPMSITDRQSGVYSQRFGSNNRVVMSVPKGAVTGKATFYIQPMDVGDMMPDGKAALVGGKIFEISAIDGGGITVNNFPELEFRFYMGDRSNEAKDIGAYNFDPAAKEWKLAGGLWYDSEEESFTLKTGHLSTYGLFKAPGLPQTLPAKASQVKGAKTYGNGTLLKGPDNRIYVVADGKLEYVSSLDTLRKKYNGQPINKLSQSAISELLGGNKAPISAVSQKQGSLPISFADLRPYYYGDGNLLKDASTGKIYLIGGNSKKHIKSPAELVKFRGRPIYSVESGELSAYAEANAVTERSKPYADGSLLKNVNGKDIYIITQGGKKKISGPSELKKYAKAKLYKVSAEALARYPLIK